jgi:MGT family glycosyltransferase
VTYVTSDRFSAEIAELGAEVIRCPWFGNVLDTSLARKECYEIVPLSARTLLDVTPFYNANRPDLIIRDHVSYAGHILSMKWNIPAIETDADLAFERADPTLLSDSVRRSREERLAANAAVIKLIKSHGVDPIESAARSQSPTLYWYPKIYQLQGDSLEYGCVYAGRCAAERPYSGTWQPATVNDRPMVLVSASTAYVQGPEYFNMCTQALLGLPFNVVLAIGNNNDPELFKSLPPNFALLHNVPQLRILPYVSVMICLGGPISTWEAMYHGIPLIMMTHGYSDPEAYADHAVELGIGVHLRKHDATVENVKNAVEQVQSSVEIRNQVKRMQYAVRRSWGAEETANFVEEYLSFNRHHIEDFPLP